AISICYGRSALGPLVVRYAPRCVRIASPFPQAPLPRQIGLLRSRLSSPNFGFFKFGNKISLTMIQIREELMKIQELLTLAKDQQVQNVDLKYVSLLGRWHHISIPVDGFTSSLFEKGIGF